MSAGVCRRTRWIQIGSVRDAWYVMADSAGFPGGYFLAWRGRVSWCQPCEFLEFSEVFWAIRRRLELAGMDLVSLATEVSRERRHPFWRKLVAEVRRGRKFNQRKPQRNLTEANEGNEEWELTADYADEQAKISIPIAGI